MRVLGRVSRRSLRWRCRRRGGAAIGGRGIVGERGGRRGCQIFFNFYLI